MDGHTVNEVFFTDVAVPAANVVGGVGDAWHRLMRGLNVERLIIAAMSIGAARRSVEDVPSPMWKQREQFGRSLGSFQSGAAPARRPGRRDRLLPRLRVPGWRPRSTPGWKANWRGGLDRQTLCTEIAKQAALEVCN